MKKYSICRSKDYRLKNYLHIKKLYINWRIICRLKKNSICKSKNYLQTELLCALSRNNVQIAGPSADQKIICRSKNYLQIGELYLQLEDLSANQRIISISKFHLQTFLQSLDSSLIWSSDTSCIYRLNTLSIWRWFFNLADWIIFFVCWLKFDL